MQASLHTVIIGGHYLLWVQPEARLLVAATARREDVDADHLMNELAASLHRRERLEEIELTRLDRGETAVLAERVTGARLPSPMGSGCTTRRRATRCSSSSPCARTGRPASR